jgi:hypothetical protein
MSDEGNRATSSSYRRKRDERNGDARPQIVADVDGLAPGEQAALDRNRGGSGGDRIARHSVGSIRSALHGGRHAVNIAAD